MCTRDDCNHPWGEQQEQVDWQESRFDDPLETMMFEPEDDWTEDLGILGVEELD